MNNSGLRTGHCKDAYEVEKMKKILLWISGRRTEHDTGHCHGAREAEK